MAGLQAGAEYKSMRLGMPNGTSSTREITFNLINYEQYMKNTWGSAGPGCLVVLRRRAGEVVRSGYSQQPRQRSCAKEQHGRCSSISN